MHIYIYMLKYKQHTPIYTTYTYIFAVEAVFALEHLEDLNIVTKEQRTFW